MIELVEKMEQKKQLKEGKVRESQLPKRQDRPRRKKQIHINFHNPNTKEDTLRYLINLVIQYLEEGGGET